ncbi:hypothetical protein GOALK_021_00160 [Gordonia alkanivorans NBRC 16433]|uniref:Uncharacterized protein n=1 Tax=Gordonia alkanivorans NBRC 16433 TaxID=1027371 RepID=F9VR69_9ACTN|nr:hypothetical protein GOALK_021_00160 [Gordonia alkanivorans NBRC 16433]
MVGEGPFEGDRGADRHSSDQNAVVLGRRAVEASTVSVDESRRRLECHQLHPERRGGVTEGTCDVVGIGTGPGNHHQRGGFSCLRTVHDGINCHPDARHPEIIP